MVPMLEAHIIRRFLLRFITFGHQPHPRMEILLGISNNIRAQMRESSWIRRMFEEGAALSAVHGAENVFDLSLGNPLLEPPPEFRDELIRIANDETPGTHRYPTNARGFPDTLAAVARGLAVDTGLPFEGDDLIMTCGAGAALNVTFRAILDPADEVVLIAPFFAEYPFYVHNQGGVPVEPAIAAGKP